ncbi:hypothetical protein AMD27_09470 [Acinetobacter sp. TGL-Y2]|nr:hypothetical protein AMD27_09470 [Acinetobacter sp. TGL-Y2]
MAKIELAPHRESTQSIRKYPKQKLLFYNLCADYIFLTHSNVYFRPPDFNNLEHKALLYIKTLWQF